MILQARILQWVAMQPLWIEPRSPVLWADSLPSEPPGKAKNTGVSSLSLLQENFPTQESNQGLLQLLNVLSHFSLFELSVLRLLTSVQCLLSTTGNGLKGVFVAFKYKQITR